MTTSQIVFISGASIFLLLGLIHGALTLSDALRHPRFFTPDQDKVRQLMINSRVRFGGGRTTMWAAWLGFNLSHSLGLCLFGGGLILIAVIDFDRAIAHGLFLISFAVAAVYALLSQRYWFYGPTIASLVGLGLFVISSVLRR